MRTKEFLVLLLVMQLESLVAIEYENEACGRQIVVVGLIAGGNKTVHGEWPWLVALIFKSNAEFFCGGSLISEKHVLSAAHCFHNKNEKEYLKAENVTAVVGKHDLDLPYELGSSDHSVLQIVLHPDWDFNSTNFDADIGLLLLFESVSFTDKIQPICLPEPSTEEAEGSGTVAGWGYSSTYGTKVEQFPRKIHVPVISSTQCYNKYSHLAKIGSNRTFCGGYNDRGISPCQGDSGGGFYQSGRSAWSILGIVSAARFSPTQSCETNQYTLYTDVAKFVYWVKNVMADGINVAIKYVNFICEAEGSTFETICTYADNKAFSHDLRIYPDFSRHVLKSSQYAKSLQLNLAYSFNMFLGLGEAFSNLESLKMFGLFVSLKKRHFDFLGRLKKLFLIDNSWLTSLTDDVFWDLWRLEELEIRGSSLVILPVNSLKTLKSLKKLTLVNNELSKLDGEIFSKTSELESLKIQENLSFDTRILPWNLTNLITFDLSGSNIQYLPEEIFSKMNKIETLDLGYNRLDSLSSSLFKGLTKLKVLNLNSNPLRFLPKGIFSDLVNLEKLNLSSCSLTDFPDQIFANSKHLTYIDASRNQLKRLEANLFDNNLNLKVVNFKYNKLEKINVDFTKFPFVDLLVFSYNQCVDIKYSRAHKEDNILVQAALIFLHCSEYVKDYEKAFLLNSLQAIQTEAKEAADGNTAEAGAEHVLKFLRNINIGQNHCVALHMKHTNK